MCFLKEVQLFFLISLKKYDKQNVECTTSSVVGLSIASD